MKFTPKPAGHSYRMGFRIVLACLLAGVVTAGGAGEARSQDLAGDKQALVALYHATDGENWANNENWLSDEPLDTWFGVTVSEGRVWQLDLAGNRLTGPIPAELGSLTQLIKLNLCCNRLTGPIPAELSSLAALKNLDLGYNQLTDIPAELGSLAALEALNLANNHLTGPIPAELGNLSSLSFLNLPYNHLTGAIPSELGSLAALRTLNLFSNRLTGSIPAELGSLADLRFLYLFSNRLTGPIPPELGSFPELRFLNLAYNELTGAIPAELGSLAALETLNLANNYLTGAIPAEMGSLSDLRFLYLLGNRLTGPIPPELSNLANLEGLDLSNNRLTGPIPLEFGGLSSLWSLNLFTNQLTGPVPPELGNLSNIRAVTLANNRLTGPIPSELGNLSTLEDLDLSTNRLTGPILPELSNLSNLERLDLSNNHLTGPIPPELGNLFSLWRSLNLSSNQLTGPIPPELGDLPSLLWSLDLGYNRLTGPIPLELGKLSNLSALTLANNQLTGPIPSELGSLANLERLDLSTNRLTGPIPLELGKLSRLRSLSLANNQLTGPIPERFTDLTLDHFYFHGNPGLSVPVDGALREWLDGIGELRDQDYSPSTLFVPVILSSAGRNDSFFTSELTLTNRGTVPANLSLIYTAHIGGESSVVDTQLAPGEQRIIPNAIDYLKSGGDRGATLLATEDRLGTLRVEPTGFSSSAVGGLARTTTLVPDGRAGLTYPAVAAESGFDEPVYLCGLRQNAQDRSNVAFQNLGTVTDGPITLRTTVFSGDPEDSRPRLLEDRTLQPGGFYQYSGLLGVLDRVGGNRQGYVKVERVEGTAPFFAYGVINDQGNSDGSFVFPAPASSLMGTQGQILPAIIRTGVFTSELMVTNFSDAAKTVTFRSRAEAVQTPDETTTVKWTFHPSQQMIFPNIVDLLRRLGMAGLGRAGQNFTGPLFATVDDGDMSGIAIGVRASSSDGRGGQYGVYYNAVPYGSFNEVAWVEALQQNEENRSNLALINTGEVNGSPSVFQIDIYDGATGMLANTLTGVGIPAGGWQQIHGILGHYAPGTTQGYVRIRKLSGDNPFLAYGIINDGGAPGQRSGDGAYLPARE